MIDLQNQVFENIPRKANAIANNMEISIDKNLFGLYTICVGILMGKTILMSIITARARFTNHVSISRSNMFLLYYPSK